MEQEKKQKLLKILKVSGQVVLSALALIGAVAIAGLAIYHRETKPEVIQQTASPKRALVQESALEPATSFPNVGYVSHTSFTINVEHNIAYTCYRYDVAELGLYSFTFPSARPTFMWIIDNSGDYPGANAILHLASADMQIIEREISYTAGDTPYIWQNGSEFVRGLTQGTMVYAIFPRALDPSGMEIVKVENLKTLVTYNFPRDFFPYQPLSGGSPMFPLISWLDMDSSVSQLQTRTLNGLYFVSNGELFDRITFDYWNVQGEAVKVDGNIIDPITQAGFWRINTIYYGTAESPRKSAVLRTQTRLDGEGNGYSDGVYWQSEVYRTIEVKYWLPNASVTFGSETRTPEEWLNILVHSTASGTASTAVLGGDSPFDLMTSAFESWIPMLGVSILPGISFGLLLFLPIIAGIIVVIFKVVKK